MTSFLHVSRRRLAAPACALALFLLLTGCGAGPLDTSTVATASATAEGSLPGTLMGGANPISGATMTLYATGNADGSDGGYGVAHQIGASTLTASDGSFYFPGPLPCPAGQFAYLVGAGGNPGGGDLNNAAVLVAALGSCEDLLTHAHIYVSELTTIAAAYALGKFSGTTTGSGASTVIGIGAPSTNNAATGCVANGGSCSVTVAAGLGHAFENAQNLVDTFVYDGVNATVPGNASAQVPVQLINSIGNSLVACVNSSGQTGSSSPCGQLFLATAIDGAAPADTWDAMVNLAANPTLAGTGESTSYLLNIASTETNVYLPFLETAPTDYSIAINYPQGTGAATGVQGLQYPQSGALDSDDIFYVANQDKSSATKSNVAAFSSNGLVLDFTPDNATYPKVRGLSADALGNIYTMGGSGKHIVLRWQSTEGSIATTPTLIASSGTSPGNSYSSAVDAANNLWFTTTGTKSSNLFKVSSTGTTGVGQLLTSPVSRALAIDPDQNVWLGTYSGSSTSTAVVLQNTGSVSSPLYSAADTTTAGLPSVAAYGIAFVPNDGPSQPYIAYFSFQKDTAGLVSVTPAIAGASEVSSISPGSLVGSTVTKGARYNAADGAGTVWTADYSGHKLVETTGTASGGTSESVSLSPCLIAGPSAISCSAIFSKPTSTAIDSAGSVWVTDPGNGSIVQLIGAATPTWPLLSLGKLGRP